MPNWCFNLIKFYGDKEIVEDFQKKLNDWTSSESIYGSDFESGWLGNILAHVFGTDFAINNSDLKYRGCITYVDDVYDSPDGGGVYFTIDTDTAWTPMIRMWKLVVSKLYGKRANINIAYMANEEGCGLNWIWDPDHVIVDSECLYHLSIWNEDDIACLENIDIVDCTAKELIPLLKELFGIKCSKTKLFRNLDAINKEIELWLKEREFEDSRFVIEKYEVVREEC